MWPLLMFLVGVAVSIVLVRRPWKADDSARGAFPPYQRDVTVKVTYDDQGQATVVVNPWVAGVKPDDVVSWTLDSPEAQDRLKIVPKGAPWPFPGPPNQANGPGNPLKSGRVQGPNGTVCSYLVIVHVRHGQPVRIDPDVIIIWDSATGGTKY